MAFSRHNKKGFLKPGIILRIATDLRSVKGASRYKL